MSDKSTNDSNPEAYKVSAYIKMKDVHFCGYCQKPYKISGLYSHMTTCPKNDEMTDDQRTARKETQNKSSKTYNQQPHIKMKNYKDQLKAQVKIDKACHDAATKLSDLKQTNMFYFYYDGKKEKDKTPIQKYIERVYFNLLCHRKYKKKEQKTLDYLKLVYTPFMEQNIIATYMKYIDDNRKFVKCNLNEEENEQVSTFDLYQLYTILACTI